MANILSQEIERQLARQLFNRTWQLIDSQDRTDEQDQMMLVTACAAYLHWDAVGTEENRAIANWQIAHVASLLGYGDLALSHAKSALGRVRTAGLPAWLYASALEGLARAHAAAGNQVERDSYLKAAIEAVAAVVDAEERKLISAQIATVPRAAAELRPGRWPRPRWQHRADSTARCRSRPWEAGRARAVSARSASCSGSSLRPPPPPDSMAGPTGSVLSRHAAACPEMTGASECVLP